MIDVHRNGSRPTPGPDAIARRHPKDPAKRLLCRRREESAVEHRARGLTFAQIAAALEAEGLGRVSGPAVSKMLKRVERRTLANMEDIRRSEIVQQYFALKRMYRELMAAWERSKEPSRRVRRKTTKGQPAEEDADGNPIPGTGRPGSKEEILEIRERCGDVAYMNTAMAVMDRLRKLLGLDSLQRWELSGPGWGPVPVAEPPASPSLADEIEVLETVGLTDEELETVVAANAIRRRVAAKIAMTR